MYAINAMAGIATPHALLISKANILAEHGICSLDMVYKMNREDRKVTPRMALKIHRKFPDLKITDLVKPDADFLEFCRIIVEEQSQ